MRWLATIQEGDEVVAPLPGLPTRYLVLRVVGFLRGGGAALENEAGHLRQADPAGRFADRVKGPLLRLENIHPREARASNAVFVLTSPPGPKAQKVRPPVQLTRCRLAREQRELRRRILTLPPGPELEACIRRKRAIDSEMAVLTGRYSTRKKKRR